MGLRGLLTSQKSSSIPVVYDERDLEQLVQGVQLLRTFRTALVFVLHRMHEAIYSGLTANGGTELILIWKKKACSDDDELVVDLLVVYLVI